MSADILHRSILVTSALKSDRFLKGSEMGADITLIDFEDSVPLECKEVARKRGIDFLSKRRNDRHCYALRINKIDLEQGIRDIMALLESDARPDIIILPKVESPYDVLIIERLMERKIGSVQYHATIETAKGLINVFEIAEASPRLKAIILGSADLADDIGSTMGWESMLYARSRIVIAASNAGIDAIDTPFFDFHDPEGLRSESERVKRMGFSGKIVIHPSQIDTVNRIFSPDKDEIAWAKKVVETRDMSQESICVVDGRMVGPPMVKTARRMLEIARRNNAY